MDPAFLGLIGFFALLVLIIIGVPVAIALALTGLLGSFYILGPAGTFELFAAQTFSYATSFNFTCVPLFLLMGYTAMYSRLTRSAYDTARLWLSGLPGGLSMATCVASGLFGACLGSGIPATAAMSRIAIPEMLRHGYDKSLAAGSVAAATTVASLIPPSIVMVIFAVFTEVSLGKLIMAGYLPGVVSIVIYMLMIAFRVRLNPKLAPRETEVVNWQRRLAALKGVWGIAVLFLVMLVGIYSGFFTATEAAAAGAVTAFLLMIVTGRFSWAAVKSSFAETLEVTAMTFLMLAGAVIFVVFITLSGLPNVLASWIVAANLPVTIFLLMITVLYIILGCFLPSVSLLLVTMPILLPVLIELQVNLIWFGIIFIKMSEVGAITPPFGLAVYVVKGVVREDIPIESVFRGIGWFVAMDLLTIAILMAFPGISLWLPGTMD